MSTETELDVDLLESLDFAPTCGFFNDRICPDGCNKVALVSAVVTLHGRGCAFHDVEDVRLLCGEHLAHILGNAQRLKQCPRCGYQPASSANIIRDVQPL